MLVKLKPTYMFSEKSKYIGKLRCLKMMENIRNIHQLDLKRFGFWFGVCLSLFWVPRLQKAGASSALFFAIPSMPSSVSTYSGTY